MNEQSDDNSECSSDSGIEVTLDQQGRIGGTESLQLNFDFSSWSGSFLTQHKEKSLDTDTVSILKEDVDAIFDGCTTFWLPAKGFTPRSTFERLAKQIFDFHTRNIPATKRKQIDWKNSGAEYWTQRRYVAGSSAHADVASSCAQPTMLRNDSSMIRFHFDKVCRD